MIKNIPLCKLVSSAGNVRRTSDPQFDLELKSDIAAHGLLQNLVVAPVAKRRGFFAVEAGERRRRALQALADEGAIGKDHEVCCLVIDRASAHEASLAENFQRLAMNPADECLAFQQLVDQGSDPETIARRFGLTVRFVEGRLRLAGLAPAIFEALGAGDISLEVAKAYAATPDLDRQAYVFEQVGQSYMASHPDSIRRMMTQATVSASDRRARFVGEEDYLAAGGRVERDLFSDEDNARWLDVELLERLALEKIEPIAAGITTEQGLAFVRPTLERWVGYPATEGLRRIPVETAALTDEESAKVEQLEEQIGALVDLLEDEEQDEAARADAEARIAELDRSIDAIMSKPPLISDELRAKLGAFLLLDDDGRPKLDPAFYMEAGPDEASSNGEAGEGAPAAPEKAGRSAQLPRRLVDELAMQRRDILAVHVAADPGFALDLATFMMIDRGAHRWGEKAGSSLIALAPASPVVGFRTPDAKATVAAAEASDALDRSWIDGTSRSERFDAFRSLPDDARGAWLGHALAGTLEASANVPGERACTFHDHLGRLLKIDVADWWRPTGANYFDRVPKSLALAALTKIGGPALAGPYSKAKKAELSQACERIFAGDFIAEIEVKQAALAWVPEAMRFAPAEAAVPDDVPATAEPGAASSNHGPDEELEEAA